MRGSYHILAQQSRLLLKMQGGGGGRELNIQYGNGMRNTDGSTVIIKAN